MSCYGNKRRIGGARYYGGMVIIQRWKTASLIGNVAESGNALYKKRLWAGVLRNCILVNGGTNEIVEGRCEQYTTVLYSDIEGGMEGEGNIDADPLFVDPLNDDYRLQAGSPCIDSGSTRWSANDLDGNPRPIDIPGLGRDGAGSLRHGRLRVSTRGLSNRDGDSDSHAHIFWNPHAHFHPHKGAAMRHQ